MSKRLWHYGHSVTLQSQFSTEIPNFDYGAVLHLDDKVLGVFCMDKQITLVPSCHISIIQVIQSVLL